MNNRFFLGQVKSFKCRFSPGRSCDRIHIKCGTVMERNSIAMLKIENIKLPPDSDMAALSAEAARILKVR